MKVRRPALPLQDFQRISNASAGLIMAESGRLIGKCVLFGLMGERLLRDRYGFADARVCVGAFGLCVAPSKTLAFAGHDGTSENRQNFHCWVEAAGFVFDFSSFLYSSISTAALGAPCPVFMFQKSKAEGLSSLAALKKPGDFFFCEDQVLRAKTIIPTLLVPALADDLDILSEWYKPPPKKMLPIGLAKGMREAVPVRLHNVAFAGSW